MLPYNKANFCLISIIRKWPGWSPWDSWKMMFS